MEQVKELYAVDSELHMLRALSAAQLYKIKLMRDVDKRNNKIVDLSFSNTLLFQNRNKALTKQLIETDRKYQLERVKPRWGSYISWAVTGLVAAVLTGYVVADQAGK
jgi:hypothetical protein